MERANAELSFTLAYSPEKRIREYVGQHPNECVVDG